MQELPSRYPLFACRATVASSGNCVNATPERLTGKTYGEYETNDPLYHFVHQLAPSCLLSSLLPSSFVICLTTPEEEFVCRKRLCTVLLFPCVLSHWSVPFPRAVLFCQHRQQLFIISLYHAGDRGSCQTTLYSSVGYRMAVCIAVSTQLYGCMAVSDIVVWQCQVQYGSVYSSVSTVVWQYRIQLYGSVRYSCMVVSGTAVWHCL